MQPSLCCLRRKSAAALPSRSLAAVTCTAAPARCHSYFLLATCLARPPDTPGMPRGPHATLDCRLLLHDGWGRHTPFGRAQSDGEEVWPDDALSITARGRSVPSRRPRGRKSRRGFGRRQQARGRTRSRRRRRWQPARRRQRDGRCSDANMTKDSSGGWNDRLERPAGTKFIVRFTVQI